MNEIVPPKEMPPFQSAPASGTLPTEQTKLIKAMNGPITTFSTEAIKPWPERNRLFQKLVGIKVDANPATIKPITSSLRSMVKSPMV